MSPAALVLVCALDILGRSSENFPAVRILEHHPSDRGPNVEAFISRHDRTINLIATSIAFAEALRAAVTERIRCRSRTAYALVASILAHEEWHLLNGEDEEGAYSAQLMTVLSSGFASDSHLFRRIMLSKIAVVNARNGAAKPPPRQASR
jgi:hypothetical protein